MRIYRSVFIIFSLVLISCAQMEVRNGAVPLEKRAAAFWEAKAAGNWEKAYSFFCSAYRAKTTMKDFARSANLRILSFKVDAIDLQEGDKKAVVTVSFDTAAMGFDLKGIKIKEEWVYEDHTWRACPGPGGFKRLFEKK